MRTDLWNGLWSLDFERSALLGGQLPWRVDVLGFPNGGNLPPVDPLAVLFFLPAGFLGTAFAYNLLIVGRLALGGCIAHGFATEFCEAHGASPEEASRAGWIAGLTLASAPVLIAGVHNGTSEAANATGLVFSVWMSWRFGRNPGGKSGRWAALGLLWATLTSWYVAVLAFAHAGFVALLHGKKEPLWKRWTPVLIGLCLVLPWVLFVVVLLQPGEHNLSAHAFSLAGDAGAMPPDNFGAADWGSWFGWSGSRDIAILVPSERGQGFFHNTHIPTLLLGLALIGIWRRGRKEAALVCLMAVSFLFSLGGEVSLAGGALPMPYAVLGEQPGFSQLGLPFRFGIGVLPAVAVFAALRASALSSRGLAVVAGLVLVQLRFFSPVAGGVPATDLRPIHASTALAALAEAPDGAVLHFPIWAHHPSLYAQRVHGKPLTIAFDWASTESDLAFWNAVREHVHRGQEADFVQTVRSLGLRYLVVDGGDPRMRGDPHYPLYQAIRERFSALGTEADESQLEVYALW
jgi:hypothetical protein